MPLATLPPTVPDDLPLPADVAGAVAHAVSCTEGYVEAQLDMLPGNFDTETLYLEGVAAFLRGLGVKAAAAIVITDPAT